MYRDRKRVGSVWIIVSKDGAKLLEAYRRYEPAEDEVVLFIEAPDNDRFSGAVRLLKAGDKIAEVLDCSWAEPLLAPANDTRFGNVLTESDAEDLIGQLSAGAPIRKWLVSTLLKGLMKAAELPMDAAILIFEGISGLLTKHLRIDEAVWNPKKREDAPGSEPPPLMELLSARIDAWSKDSIKDKQGIANSKQALLAGFVGTLKDALGRGMAQYKDLATPFFCGFWNSLIDIVASLFDLIALLLKGFKGSMAIMKDPFYYFSLLLEYANNLLQAVANIDWAAVMDEAAAFAAKLNKLVAELPAKLLGKLSAVSAEEWAYAAGYIACIVLDLFIPLLDLLVPVRLLKAMEPVLAPFMDFMKGVLKGSGRQITNIAEAFFEVIKAALAKLKEGAKAVKEFFEELWKALLKWLEDTFGIKPKPAQEDLLENWDKELPVSGRGDMSGQKLLKRDLKAIKSFLAKWEWELELHPEKGEHIVEGYFNAFGEPIILREKAAAMFVCTSEKGKVVLREGCTAYEFFHEFMHARHAKSLGLNKYISLGGKGTRGELMKEQQVFDKIVENKDLFTRRELEHAQDYINEKREPFDIDPVTFDFDIEKIPAVRKEIKTEDILKIK